MDRTITTTAPADPAAVHDIVADLGTYPHWLSLVDRVEEAEPGPGEAGPVWWVTLRAKVGPLSRRKRLRMVRVVDRPPTAAGDDGTVRFERREVDGRDHSAWTMSVHVSPNGTNASTVAVALAYDGSLWNGALESVLGGAIDGAVDGLHQYVAEAEAQ